MRAVDVERETRPAAPPSADVEDIGPRRPSTEVQAEVAALLEADDTRLGQVYRGLQRGLTAEVIATELDVASSNFVWNYERIIRAMLHGDLPTAPSVALQAARRFRKLLKSSRLSSSLRSYLEMNLAELERKADDPTARAVEAQRALEQTEQAESRSETGIYVYALPHYLRYPFDPESGRTLMKVGQGDHDVILRFRNQTRTTALPEEPILLRIYRTTEPTVAIKSIESDFHRLLEAADHYRSVERTAGKEWFVTSTRFLDEVARVMRLPVVFANEVGAPEEG
jgi:hypothetical protein